MRRRDDVMDEDEKEGREEVCVCGKMACVCVCVGV